MASESSRASSATGSRRESTTYPASTSKNEDLQDAIEDRPSSIRSSSSRSSSAKQNPTSSSNEDDGETVQARAAELASRQAARTSFRLHEEAHDVYHTSDEVIAGIGRPSGSVTAGDDVQDSLQSSPNFRRRQKSAHEMYGLTDAPQIDEDAIHAVTAANGGKEDEQQDRSVASKATSIESQSSKAALPPKEGEDPVAHTDTDVGDYADAEQIDRPVEINEPGDAGFEERDADVSNANEEAKEATEESEREAPNLEKKESASQAHMTSSMATLRRKPGLDSNQGSLAQREKESDAQSDGSKSEDDDEEEEEPTLKYSRLRGSVPDILKKDSSSALAASDRFLALGTHGGSIYVLDEQGNLTKGFRSHSASVLSLTIDSTSEFVGSAGMDGIVSISSLSTSEAYHFDFKRVMRTISLEPGFGRRSTRSFVCGGMAGQLVLREKTWFGHREQVLHEGEGPIWTTQWLGNFVAWANDRGVRVYDMANRRRLAFFAPPEDMPRADLFRCTLFWQDDSTLVIGWGDCIKIAKVRHGHDSGKGNATLLASAAKASMEVTSILQLDCMISGIASRGTDFLVLAYITDEDFDDSTVQQTYHGRRDGQRPELRLISRDGEELSSDVLSLQSFARFQCNDYLLVPSAEAIASARRALTIGSRSQRPVGQQGNQDIQDYFYVVSPKDIVIARSRDEKDHVDWLLEHKKYQDALSEVEKMGSAKATNLGFDIDSIGERFLGYLIHNRRDWTSASTVAAKILKDNTAAWENFILAAADQGALTEIISAIPTGSPKLGTATYDLILASFLRFDVSALLETIQTWPPEIYSTQAVILALEDRLSRSQERSALQREAKLPSPTRPISDVVDRSIMECLAQVFLLNRQPGRALPYYMRLRKPGVFALIKDHNLFTVVQDQALLLVEFEQDLNIKTSRGKDESESEAQPMQAIQLLVDHIHSIPIYRVVAQLEKKPFFLFLYLDALFSRDPQLVSAYADVQVALLAEFDHAKLMSYLRTMSSYYSFEKAYQVCKSRDYVPEMVFLLSRIGDSKTALMLIIERLGDVERAISFVKEEKDPELWDDLVQYSEDKPNFIRGLLENVGGEVDAGKLIRKIKNGLEIPCLKDALIKILSDFTLQISLLEGCAEILDSDCRAFSLTFHGRQSRGFYCGRDTICASCGEAVKAVKPNAVPQDASQRSRNNSDPESVSSNIIVFLCGHAHHLFCLAPNQASLPKRSADAQNDAKQRGEQEMDNDSLILNMTTTRAFATGQLHAAGIHGPQTRAAQQRRLLQQKQKYAARLRVILKRGCPLCHAERN